MATISAGSASYKNSPRRQYVATAAFNNDFFAYTTGRDASYAETGTLVAVTGATAANCPQGRILRETGRKMYPGNAYPGVSTYMVSVYDDQSLLGGFIDPNSPVFAVSNSDKPSYLANPTNPKVGGLADAGQPVYTKGSVSAGSSLAVTGGPLVQYRAITNLATTTGLTLTASSTSGGLVNATTGGIIAGLISQTTVSGSDLTVNLPSTSSIITAISSIVGAASLVGATTDFIFVETGGGAQSLLTRADTSTTMIGFGTSTHTTTQLGVGGEVARFLIVVTSATTITIYKIANRP